MAPPRMDWRWIFFRSSSAPMWNSISAYLKDFGYQQSLLVQYQAASQKNMVTGEDTVR